MVAFVVAGRASHDHAEAAPGIASTLWPFAAGTLAGWALVARRSPASVPSGAVVCASTVVAGMALRAVSGRGTAPSFVAVATGFLGTVMLGGRVAMARWGRRDGRGLEGA